MTSATDVLRSLLDEHDEYYKTSGNKTWWGRPIDRQTGKPINVFHYQAQPMGEDRLLVELQLATPEQAIAATLGTGTCREVMINRHWRGCSECGYVWENMYAAGFQTGPNYCPMCGAKVVD
jgi:rubrerythrin